MRFPHADITRIDLVRHGEPVGGRMLRGETDHPLSELGWQQMRNAIVARHVDELPPYDAIVTSPLSRCREFALWLGTQYELPVEVDDDLAEMHLGAWEGRTHAEVLEEDEEDGVAAFWTDPVAYPPPQGETIEALNARVGQAWQRLLDHPPGRHVLVVCHLFVTNLILRQVIAQPLERALAMDLPYAAMCRLRHERHARGDTTLIEWIGR